MLSNHLQEKQTVPSPLVKAPYFKAFFTGDSMSTATEFDAGYRTARLHSDDPSLTLDGKSAAFIDGYSRYMHEQSCLSGPDDTDSYDY
jgi:hypothetical protein